MALHKKRENTSSAVARLLLESTEALELPPAEIDEEGVTLEREQFAAHLPELFDFLREGGWVDPAPIVQSDSLFVIDGDTRTFWVRVWHTDETRTRIARLHVVSCLPFAPNIQIDLGGSQT